MTATTRRKAEHIDICLDKNVQARNTSTGFEDIHLIHRAVPRTSFEEMDISTELFGHELAAPIIIEAMTGGTERAALINQNLAQAAENYGIALGIGSQRVALEATQLTPTFTVARDNAPHTLLIGNLGAPQIMGTDGLNNVKTAIRMIHADAFAIHLNSLQETMQPEGDTNFVGVLEQLQHIVSNVNIPIIAKETGAGFAAEEAQLLESIGIQGIDIGGAGGTSWAAVESYRAKMQRDITRETLGRAFWDWGIPTAISTVEVRQTTELTIIASGGIRTGIDIAKAIALGANAVGIAIPLLKPALHGQLSAVFDLLIKELKIAMFLTGATSIKELQSAPMIITGKTADWLRSRGFHPEKYATRRGIP
ncbi:MAG: type 2 isopentenyl-diphosphate Delta-isomerase [Candidatus Bathyarchaeota archaeon]|nr:MAG: type 2 isopentenyl-diphosphate Delta-isomerase [Candidatus Bathyarchaeota archaeon]